MNYTKHPRTFHLPWSLGATSDDKILGDLSSFKSENIVISEKLDGENTSIYSDHCHARSLESKHHDSRSHIKALQARIGHLIPAGWRIVGENVYAKHSIAYSELESYFYGVFVFDENNVCLSWDDTLAVFKELGITPVPVLYEGIWPSDFSKFFTGISLVGGEQEGYVVRSREAFAYEDFSSNVAKFVRANHVQTDKHWTTSWKPNTIRGKHDKDQERDSPEGSECSPQGGDC